MSSLSARCWSPYSIGVNLVAVPDPLLRKGQKSLPREQVASCPRSLPGAGPRTPLVSTWLQSPTHFCGKVRRVCLESKSPHVLALCQVLVPVLHWCQLGCSPRPTSAERSEEFASRASRLMSSLSARCWSPYSIGVNLVAVP